MRNVDLTTVLSETAGKSSGIIWPIISLLKYAFTSKHDTASFNKFLSFISVALSGWVEAFRRGEYRRHLAVHTIVLRRGGIPNGLQ